MMRIIALLGLPNSGKTSTLILVYNLLLQNGGISTNRQALRGNPHDFSDIVIWNGRRIAIFTMGDYSTDLVNAINSYANQNCDVMICALSTNPPKVRANNALNRFNAQRINKTIAPNGNAELAANTTDAQMIFNLI